MLSSYPGVELAVSEHHLWWQRRVVSFYWSYDVRDLKDIRRALQALKAARVG